MLAQGLNRNAATRPGANVIQGLRPGLPQLAANNAVMTGSGGSPMLQQLLTSMIPRPGGPATTIGDPSMVSTGQMHPGSPGWDEYQQRMNDPNWLQNYQDGFRNAFGSNQMPQKPSSYTGSYNEIPKPGGIPLTQDQLGGPSVANTTNWTRGPAAPTTTIPGATAIGDPYQPGIGPLTSIPGAPTTSIPAPAQAGNIGQRFTDAYGNPAGGQPNDTVLQQLLARLREQSGGRGNTYNGGGTGSTRMSDSRLPAQGNNGMPAVAPMETRIPAPGAGRTGSGGGLGDMLSRLQRR